MTAADAVRARAEQLAREEFGWDELRPAQLTAITTVAGGRDTLAVMPTGSGKSAIYQIAGRLLGGPTIVVSPLIALQRDQRESIEALTGFGDGAPRVAVLNSTLPAHARDEVLRDSASGAVDFLFLAPEQLGNPEVIDGLRDAHPALLVVDEAHCVVSWGADFRPDYQRLGSVVDALGGPTVLALTATAAPPVRTDLARSLRLRDPQVLVAGFDRPNLHLDVRSFLDADDKVRAVIDAAVALPGPGIVYVAKRREAQEFTDLLVGRGVAAAPYHAGMKAAERAEHQDRFLAGDIDVLVATTAFGMGIDKPDIRFVLHATVAESLDAYYQEIGRAGRDGEPASVVLFYRQADLGLRRFFTGGGFDDEAVRTVLGTVRKNRSGLRGKEIAARTRLNRKRVTNAVNLLEQVDAVGIDAESRVIPIGAARSSTVVERAEQVTDRRKAFGASRVEMMRGYAEATTCRRVLVLSYFGETAQAPCGNCDICEAQATVDPPAAEAEPVTTPFQVGERVDHPEFGIGTVMRFEDERIVVLFDEQGYRTLSLPAVLDHRLLEAAS
jgi:ATP-dependent DNA helicase RecQ